MKKNTSAEKVKTLLPKDPTVQGAEAEQEFFSVNFKNYLVKTDEMVELPEPLAEVVQNRANARRQASKYASKVAFRDSKPPTV